MNTALFDYLASLGIKTTTITHEPLFTVEQAQGLKEKLSGAHVKNLFLKDNKNNFWLIVACDTTKISLKDVAKQLGAPGLRFAQEEQLQALLGVKPGSVTPFGLIHDKEHKVHVVLDRELLKHDLLNFHPLINTATTTIAREDFKKFLTSCSNAVTELDFQV